MVDSKQIIGKENKQSSRVRERNHTLDWEANDSERLNALKQERSAKKGLVTKAQNEIRDLMLDFANVTVVKEKVHELKIVVQFSEAHSAYHSQLREESDLVESDEYSQLVGNSVKDQTGDIVRWVASEEFASSCFEVPRFKDSVSNIGLNASGRSKLSFAASKVSPPVLSRPQRQKHPQEELAYKLKPIILNPSKPFKGKSLVCSKGRLWSFVRRSPKLKPKNSRMLRLKQVVLVAQLLVTLLSGARSQAITRS